MNQTNSDSRFVYLTKWNGLETVLVSNRQLTPNETFLKICEVYNASPNARPGNLSISELLGIDVSDKADLHEITKGE